MGLLCLQSGLAPTGSTPICDRLHMKQRRPLCPIPLAYVVASVEPGTPFGWGWVISVPLAYLIISGWGLFGSFRCQPLWNGANVEVY